MVTALVGLPLAGSAQTPPPTTAPISPPATVPIPPPAAFIVVDMGTGAVLFSKDEHVRRPPASISKLMTALVARRRLGDDAPISVSPAAAGMPARKLDIQPGQVWKESDLLQAMLLCSCNDIARALAENAGGSVGGFGTLARAEAARLGVVDAPVLQDPAGLDDEFSVGGGNRVSAYDMAVIARAFEADPTLAAAVQVPTFRFAGPDGVTHEVVNHNRLFGTYAGAIGVKTGYTRRAGATLVAAATRNGRTILVVILGSADIWYHAPQLLDYGFRVPATASQARLPAVPSSPEESAAAATTVPATVPASTVPSAAGSRTSPQTTAPRSGTASGPADPTKAGSSRPATIVLAVVAAIAVVALALLVALRRRRVVRRQAAERARRRAEAVAALVHD